MLDVEEPAQGNPLMATETFNKPSAPDLGDADFVSSDTARSLSEYSYTSNPLSGRDFQKMLDLDETGESFTQDVQGSGRTLQVQLSGADRSFGETHERDDNDQPDNVTDRTSNGEVIQDGSFLLDAESGEVVRPGSAIDKFEDDIAEVSAMETLPVRGSDPLKGHEDDEGDEVMEISDDEVVYVETPRSVEVVSKDEKQEDDVQGMEGGNDKDSKSDVDDELDTNTSKIDVDMTMDHSKLTLKTSILSDEDVSERSDENTSYIPSPKIGEVNQELNFGNALGKDDSNKIKETDPVVKSAEMDVSSEDIESLDSDVELKSPRDHDQSLSHAGFEVEMETNDGALFQSTTSESEVELKQEAEVLDLENESTNSNSVTSSPKEERRAKPRKESLDESIPEEIEVESSDEDERGVDNEEQETDPTVEQVTITEDTSSVGEEITNVSSTETLPIRGNDSMKRQHKDGEGDEVMDISDDDVEYVETPISSGREEEEQHKGDEVMEISDDDVEYVETSRSLENKEELTESDKETETDSSATEDTVLIVETNRDMPNKHPKLIRESSILGDEDVAGRSDAHTDYIPSPEVGQVHQEFLSEETANKRKSLTNEDTESVFQSTDVKVATEDADSLDGDVELKTSQDYDRRLSHDGFEVDDGTNYGVLFQSSTSDDFQETEKPEEDILEIENEVTPISSTNSSPSKEKKTVTFGNTYALRAVGDDVIEVSLGDSIEFVESSSDEDSEDDADTKEIEDEARKILDNKPFDVSKLGDETIECNDEEYVKTPRTEAEDAGDISIEKEIDYIETPRDSEEFEPDSDRDYIETPRDSEEFEPDSDRVQEVESVNDEKHLLTGTKEDEDEDKISQSSGDDSKAKDQISSDAEAEKKSDVSYESDYSDSDSLDDEDEFSDRVDLRRTMGRTYDVTKQSDEDNSTSSNSNEGSEAKTKDKRNERQGTDDESIPEEIEFESSGEDAKGDASLEETILTVSPVSDLGRKIFDFKDTKHIDEAVPILGEISNEEENKDADTKMSATYKIDSCADEITDVNDMEDIETSREEFGESTIEAKKEVLDAKEEIVETPRSPGQVVGSMYAGSDLDDSVVQVHDEQNEEPSAKVQDTEEIAEPVGRSLSSTMESEVSEVTMNEDSDQKSKYELGTTFKVETYEDEVVTADDVEYVKTPRDDMDDVAAVTSRGLSVEEDVSVETPRTPGRVIGSMFAECDDDDNDDGDVKPDDETTHEPMIVSGRQSEMDTNNVLGHSLSSTVGTEGSEVKPLNDDKFRRMYEVLHGDDDDVEYIERWHSPTETTSAKSEVKPDETPDKEQKFETKIKDDKSEDDDNKDIELKNEVNDLDSDDGERIFG